jgi:hypothetical protein
MMHKSDVLRCFQIFVRGFERMHDTKVRQSIRTMGESMRRWPDTPPSSASRCSARRRTRHSRTGLRNVILVLKLGLTAGRIVSRPQSELTL